MGDWTYPVKLQEVWVFMKIEPLRRAGQEELCCLHGLVHTVAHI